MDAIPPPTIEVIVASIANGRRLNAHIDRDLKDLGLTWGRFHMLVVLNRTNGWIHAGSLARKMGITRQSAHALLHHLDERGFLRWMHDPWVHSARLTTDGARILAQAHEALGDTFAAIERVEVPRTQGDRRGGVLDQTRTAPARPPPGVVRGVPARRREGAP